MTLHVSPTRVPRSRPMAFPSPRVAPATVASAESRLPTRASRGERRLRALARLAIPERCVPILVAVEPRTQNRTAAVA